MLGKNGSYYLRILGALFGVFIIATAAPADDDDKVREVVCGKSGNSVQEAIDKVKHGRDATIYLRGNCDESVLITRDGITLSGNGDGDGTIDGRLREVAVTGAQRVRIEYLEITGAGYGVLATAGAAVTVSHSDIHDNEFDGIGAFNQVYVRVTHNQIVRNGRPAPWFEAGIDAAFGSTIRSIGNYVADNGYAAVAIGNQSFYRSGIFFVDPPDPADIDIILQKGCERYDPAGSCGDPDTTGVDCYRGGICDFRNTDVTGAMFASDLSIIDARNSVINGNVGGSRNSVLRIRDTVTGSGQVQCFSGTQPGGLPCLGFIP